MSRRAKGDLPEPRFHAQSRRYRIRYQGQTYWFATGIEKGSPAYWERLREILDEISGVPEPSTASQAGSGIPAGLTVRHLCVAFMDHAKRHYIQRTTGRILIVRRCCQILDRLFADMPVDDVSPRHLVVLRDKLIVGASEIATPSKSARKSRPLSRRYINDLVSQVCTIFRWGVEQEIVSPETWHGLRAVRPLRTGHPGVPEPPPVESVSVRDLARTLRALDQNGPVATMLRIQYLTGARPGEIAMLRANEIDMSSDVWVYSPSEHKNAHRNDTRLIFLGPKAQRILRPFLAANQEGFLFPANSMENRPYTKDSYCRAVKRAAKRAGVPAWTPNQLRHAAATRITNRHGIEKAKVVLGHKKITTTQRYVDDQGHAAAALMREEG